MMLARSSQLAKRVPGVALRGYATPSPSSLVSVPVNQQLATQKAKFWEPKKSNFVEGFSLMGILGGTMLLCVVPGILAALEPPKSDH